MIGNAGCCSGLGLDGTEASGLLQDRGTSKDHSLLPIARGDRGLTVRRRFGGSRNIGQARAVCLEAGAGVVVGYPK